MSRNILKFRAAINRAGIPTQREFASLIGKHEAKISRVLRRERRLSPRERERWTAVLGVDVDEILGGGLMIAERYREKLTSIPAPGGNGCHPAILGAANLGVMAGLDPDAIFRDIRSSIPPGGRKTPDREIHDAIRRAVADHGGSEWQPRPRTPKPTVKNGKAVLEKILARSWTSDEADLWEASPIRLLGAVQGDRALFLETLFDPENRLFIGDRHEAGVPGENIRTVSQWISYFRNGGSAGPLIIVNPVSGNPAPKESGDGETFRGNRNITAFRHVLVEFDNLSREDQIRFWTSPRLPVKALVDSGNKSVHAWIDVQALARVETAEDWIWEIKGRLFRGMLEPVGVDPACGHPARLARFPGCIRAEKGTWQRILWLSEVGKRVRC